MNKNFKSCGLELKDLDDAIGIVSFYFSSFGNKDSDGDILQKGAFTKSIKENLSRIKHFKNHDPKLAVGKILELGEDEKGAFAVSQLAEHKGEFTQLAKDTLIEYNAGLITEHSHGFQTINESFSKDRDANIITEVKLWEVSSLTHWGANSQTPVTGIKSLEDVGKIFKSLEKLLKNSDISDERGLELQKSYDQLGTLIKSLGKPSESDTSKADILKREDDKVKFLKALITGKN